MLKTFVKSVFAGGAISLGGAAFICSQNKVIGSLFFVVGLFLVLTLDLNLFTGKICYLFDNKKGYVLDLLIIYLGNFIGSALMGSILHPIMNTELITSFTTTLTERVSRDWWKVVLLGILCNICIYVAVDGYRNMDKEWKKILSLFFGVSVFVLCGFEHCIADMFYIFVCNTWSVSSLVFLLEVTLGNILGGLIIPSIKLVYRIED